MSHNISNRKVNHMLQILISALVIIVSIITLLFAAKLIWIDGRMGILTQKELLKHLIRLFLLSILINWFNIVSSQLANVITSFTPEDSE